MLREHLHEVEDRIRRACERSGRKREEVGLIAVSKTKPLPMLQEIYDCGQRHFGENKVQEIREKFGQLPADVNWHMIGHLQKNKIKYIVDKVCMIHSVDSYELAECIDRECSKKNIEPAMPVLIEVNVAEEETKFGLKTEEVLPLIRKTAGLSHVRVMGLMTIAPYVEDPEDNRPVFRKLRQLSVDIARENIDNISMNVLSMGMTNDYEVAIEEGSTLVRVGTGIFGDRSS